MLHSLHVENLALIDETEVSFKPGLNILTGETGAGKSLLVGSINLALGAKSDSDLIRTGEEYALVELNFESHDPELFLMLEKMEIPVDGCFVNISRRIMPGRSIIKINGESCNAKQLKAVTELLIDIHGQHEHQSLLDKKKHLEILDLYSGDELLNKLDALKEIYSEYTKAKHELENGSMDEDERRRTMELYEFEYNEIVKAELKPGEDEELEKAFKKMSNAKKIGDALTGVCALCGNDEEGSAGLGLGRALKEMRSVSSLDEELENMEQSLAQIEGLLHDFHREAEGYLDNLEVDGSVYYATEERLNLINKLKDKYNKDIDGVLLYADELKVKMDEITNYEERISKLNDDVIELKKKVDSMAEEISAIRRSKAMKLEETLVSVLKELSFPDVRFKIDINKKSEPNELGFDDVEFLISANVGEAMRPLKDVASGGELSRIMLGIKTLLADKDSIDTLIFDEIDAGISGRTAWQVAGKLGELGKAHQVICITHLPQIAARADEHFIIQKDNDGVRTNTHIRSLDYEGSVAEVARLLGSEDVSESALNNARELIKKAKELG